MRAYRVANPRLTAMRKLLERCDEATVLHYDGDALPTIEEAFARTRPTAGCREKA